MTDVPSDCPECGSNVAKVFIDGEGPFPTGPPVEAYCTSDYCSWEWARDA